MKAALTPDQKNNIAALRVGQQLILRHDAKQVGIVKRGARRFVTATIEHGEASFLVKSRWSGDWQLQHDEQDSGADYLVLIDESQKTACYYMFKASWFITNLHERYAEWLASEAPPGSRSRKRAGHRAYNDDTHHTRISDAVLDELLPNAVDSWTEMS